MSCFCQDKLASYNVLYQNKQFAFPTFISTNSFTSEYLVVMTTESPFLIYSCFPNYSTLLHTYITEYGQWCGQSHWMFFMSFINGQSTVTTHLRTNKTASDAENPGLSICTWESECIKWKAHTQMPKTTREERRRMVQNRPHCVLTRHLLAKWHVNSTYHSPPAFKLPPPTTKYCTKPHLFTEVRSRNNSSTTKLLPCNVWGVYCEVVSLHRMSMHSFV